MKPERGTDSIYKPMVVSNPVSGGTYYLWFCGVTIALHNFNQLKFYPGFNQYSPAILYHQQLPDFWVVAINSVGSDFLRCFWIWLVSIITGLIETSFMIHGCFYWSGRSLFICHSYDSSANMPILIF